MRSRQMQTGFSLAICYLPFTIATPKVADNLLLPLRIPQQGCHKFSSYEIKSPSSVPNPATNCSWKDILDCGAQEINCGQICLGTVQRVPTAISPLSPQCRTCLSPSTISHCAACFGTHIPTGFTPSTHASAPSITRDDLCAAAKAFPGANCIAEAFCPEAEDGKIPPTASNEEEEEEDDDDESDATNPLAAVEQIIAGLGSDAVGDVDVQQPGGAEEPTTTTGGTAGRSSSSSSSAAAAAASSMGAEPRGRAAGLCGKFFCT
ncbi:MAG: hypothetical protein L6R36_004411 [Xanthoria steineri]|nr:MAG: hypothetical protein L6R36_004411 [Xanthoria steineri]